MIISKALRLLLNSKKTLLLVFPITALLLAAPAHGEAGQFRLSGVTKINGQYLVNLVDSQESQGFWLKEGGRSHGYELLEVDQQGGFARIRKNGQTFIVNLKSSAVEVQKSESGEAAAPLTLKNDDFGKVGEDYIKDLFNGGGRDENFVTGKLSRDDYHSKQKDRFELHESRKGHGIVYFQTDEGNYGKLLYTWGSEPSGPKLKLKEIATFDSRTGKSLVRNAKDIALQSAGHMDLDDGIGTGRGANGWGGGIRTLPDDYEPDLHFSNVDGETMYLRGTDDASFLFPIPNGS